MFTSVSVFKSVRVAVKPTQRPRKKMMPIQIRSEIAAAALPAAGAARLPVPRVHRAAGGAIEDGKVDAPQRHHHLRAEIEVVKIDAGVGDEPLLCKLRLENVGCAADGGRARLQRAGVYEALFLVMFAADRVPLHQSGWAERAAGVLDNL